MDDKVPWYAQPSWLEEDVVKMIHGYQGKVAKRWHVVPRGLLVLRTWEEQVARAQTNYKVGDTAVDTFTVAIERQVGVVTPTQRQLMDATICERILYLRAVTTSNDDLAELGYMTSFSWILYDVADARDRRFGFDILYCEGDEDESGFYAVVWRRDSNVVVAHAEGDRGKTHIDWLAPTLLEEYTPHGGSSFLPRMRERYLVPSKKAKRNGWNLPAEYLASTDSRCGLVFSCHDNELEHLIPVAAKLAQPCKAGLFPTHVPDTVVHDVIAWKLLGIGLTLHALPLDVWQLISSFFDTLIFRDAKCAMLGRS
ncbi:hypothetical protein LEN26_009848 [Aphanomyces euteiches]|nr:hypothetical protein LEN26_009848 [Aphanomyces euteiches]